MGKNSNIEWTGPDPFGPSGDGAAYQFVRVDADKHEALALDLMNAFEQRTHTRCLARSRRGVISVMWPDGTIEDLFPADASELRRAMWKIIHNRSGGYG